MFWIVQTRLYDQMSCFLERIRRKEKRKKALVEKENLVKEESTQGIYKCSSCGNALFDAAKKFDSGTGFPSFWMHLEENVKENFLDTYGRERIQLLCSQCGLHLGHLFKNKNTPTKLRYCINADAIEWSV